MKRQPVRQGQTTTPGALYLLFVCSSVTSPANHVTGTLKIEWTSAFGYSSYLRRLVMLVSSLIAPARYGKIKLW